MVPLSCVLCVAVACGGDASSESAPEEDRGAPGQGTGGGGSDQDDGGVEQEEFLVKELATTSSYVFVPNSSPESHTVARIDGRDLSIRPIRVGAQPEEVRAADVDGVGAVAYVLCEGDSTVAIVRADEPAIDGVGFGTVSLLRVPREVNALQVSPDGRFALAYIDPSKGVLGQGASVAAIQSMALIRLGARREEDAVFELSVTREVRNVSFDSQSQRAFIVGKEGVNVLDLEQIDSDRFVPPLRLALSDDIFPPDDLEIVVSRDGDYFALRSSQLQRVVVVRLDPPGTPGTEVVAQIRGFEFDESPSDIDLLQRGDGARDALIVTLRAEGRSVWLDPVALLAQQEEGAVEEDDVVIARHETGAGNGLTQVSSGGEYALTYTTLSISPVLDAVEIEAGTLERHPLLNQIRSVALSKDGEVAIVVHRPQSPKPEDGEAPIFMESAQDRFRLLHGLTLVDLSSGYRRPVALEGEPVEIIAVASGGEDEEQLVYVTQRSANPAYQGVLRLSLESFRTDFTQLAKEPTQIGLVAGKVFVNQRSDVGRITFIDLDGGAQRTISGYELNARID